MGRRTPAPWDGPVAAPSRTLPSLMAAALGFWLLAVPWSLGLVLVSQSAAWNQGLVGLGTIVLAFASLRGPGRHWAPPLIIGLGLWLAASPWLLGHATQPLAVGNAAMSGAMLVTLGIARIFVERQPAIPQDLEFASAEPEDRPEDREQPRP